MALCVHHTCQGAPAIFVLADRGKLNVATADPPHEVAARPHADIAFLGIATMGLGRADADDGHPHVQRLGESYRGADFEGVAVDHPLHGRGDGPVEHGVRQQLPPAVPRPRHIGEHKNSANPANAQI